MKIAFYILKHFLFSLFRSSCFVMFLVFLVDLIDQFAIFSDINFSAGYIFLFCILRLPDSYLQFLPLIILLSALFCFTGLSRTSEVVIFRSAGISAGHMVFIPVLTVFLIGILNITVFNPFIVETRVAAKGFDSQFRGEEDSFLSISSDHGIWFRAQEDGYAYLFRFDHIDWKKERAKGVTLYAQKDAQLDFELRASSARIKNGQWLFNDAVLSYFNGNIVQQHEEHFKIPTNLNFHDFFEDQNPPEFVENYKLPEHIDSLERDGYDNTLASSYFLQQLASPFLLMCMCLIGSIFALAPERFGGTSRRLILALGFGFSAFGLTQLSQSLGEAGNLPLNLAVFGVPIASTLIAISVLLFREEG